MLPCYRGSSVAAAAPHAEFHLLYALSVAAAALSAEVRKLGLVVRVSELELGTN